MSLTKEYLSTRTSVSIITVCKNSAKSIGRTIESIVSQRIDGLEYIVVDGSSDDGTQEIIRSYGNQIDIFLSEPDAGIADAFNKGIQLSSGGIIGLINSDDVLLPGALNEVRRFFTEQTETDVLHGDVHLYDGDRFLKRAKPAGRWWYPWRLLLFNHPATFVRKRIYQEFGLFSTEYIIAMDVEIFTRWMKNEVAISYLPIPLVKMQTGGMSGRNVFLGYREARKALIANGFPRVIADAQLISRYLVQVMLNLSALFRNRFR